MRVYECMQIYKCIRVCMKFVHNMWVHYNWIWVCKLTTFSLIVEYNLIWVCKLITFSLIVTYSLCLHACMSSDDTWPNYDITYLVLTVSCFCPVRRYWSPHKMTWSKTDPSVQEVTFMKIDFLNVTSSTFLQTATFLESFQ